MKKKKLIEQQRRKTLPRLRGGKKKSKQNR